MKALHALIVSSVSKNRFYSEASAFICGVQLHHNGAVSSNFNLDLTPGQICTQQLIKHEKALTDYGITDFQNFELKIFYSWITYIFRCDKSPLSFCDAHFKLIIITASVNTFLWKLMPQKLMEEFIHKKGLLCFTLQAAWLLRAVTCIDLTTLSGDDTTTNVQRLCYKAKHPIRTDLLKSMSMDNKGEISSMYMLRITHSATSTCYKWHMTLK